MNGRVLLQGVVGSTAYGLAHEGSDVDRLGVFAAPTQAFHGLTMPKPTHTSTKPDVAFHEVAKWCQLALGCNPTVMELVWLDSYEVTTPLGVDLVDIRRSFLSRDRVRGAYLGYAGQQFNKLRERIEKGKDGFGTVPVARSEKHARHMLRLLEQGVALHLTGRLPIRVENPVALRVDAARIVEEPEFGVAWIGKAERMFARPGVLPTSAADQVVEAWLRCVRREMWMCSEEVGPELKL